MSLQQTDPDSLAFIVQIAKEYGHDNDKASLYLLGEYMRLFAVKGLSSPYLLRLYVKRAFAQYVQSQHLETADYREEDEEVRSHLIPKNFQAQIDELTAEIIRVEGQILSLTVGIGQMTNVVPSPSPAGLYPANSAALIGGPDSPGWFRR